MAKAFEKGALFVLVLVFLLGAVMAIYSARDQQDLDDVIAITDSRTEYLLEQVKDLNKRVSSLERTR